MASSGMLHRAWSLMKCVNRSFLPTHFGKPLQQRLLNSQNRIYFLANQSRSLSALSSLSPTSKSPQNSAHLLNTNISDSGNVFAITNAIQMRNYQYILKPRLICDGCYYVWRHGRKYVECSDHPRHKQAKKIATRHLWQEDYSRHKYVKAMDWNKRLHREFDRNVDRKAVSHSWLAGKLGKEV